MSKSWKGNRVILDTCVLNSCLSFPPPLSFLVYLNGFIFLIFKILYKSEDNTNFTAYTKSYSVRSRIWKFDISSTSNYLYTTLSFFFLIWKPRGLANILSPEWKRGRRREKRCHSFWNIYNFLNKMQSPILWQKKKKRLLHSSFLLLCLNLGTIFFFLKKINVNEIRLPDS